MNRFESPSASSESVGESNLEQRSSEKIIRLGMEKMHAMFNSGRQGESDYMALAHLLIKNDGGQNVWKSQEEIDADAVELVLGRINDDEAFERSWKGERVVADTLETVDGEIEQESGQLGFEKIDPSLFKVNMGDEGFRQYVEQQRNLPPDGIVYLYHGLNGGGYKDALRIIDSPSHGIAQRSGPTVSLVPVGQFWRGVGFRYALRRDQINFPGDNHPNAVVQMMDKDGMEDVGHIINESESLPLDKFEAKVMRSAFSDPDPEAEAMVLERMQHFSDLRDGDNRKDVMKDD